MGWTSPALIEPWLQAADSSQVIRALGGLLLDQGYVRDTFIQAVLDREKVFATGLPTPVIQVAIPHADVEHVLQSAIAVASLRHPVEFGEMGNPEGTVQARIVFMLAVKESDSLVSLLQNLVGIFQDADFLKRILESQDRTTIAELFNARLPSFQEA
ncbi:MAG: PTS sugar transporter subunit IIA [Anaerolineales bacterium]|jgi:PTS system galactitol-specific IIA component